MPNRLLSCVVLVAGLALLPGCWNGEPAGTTPPGPEPSGDRLTQSLLEVGQAYQSYGRLNPTLLRWAPTDCAAPRLDLPAAALYSKSSDAETHGQKLYSLFVKVKPEGGFFGGTYVVKPESPVGQVIVKETWLPERITELKETVEPGVKNGTFRCKKEDGTTMTGEITDGFRPFAQKDKELFHAAKKGPLFVMMKLDPKTPGTDNGWVYAALSPDGKNVQAAGRIESCMSCHKDAPTDRLFGLPKE